MSIDSRIAAVRRFNRFYTREIGVLEEGLQNSPYSLTEARILYELAKGGAATAKGLVDGLGLDPGYVSRILKKFEDAGLVARSPDPADGRASRISLTGAGMAAFRPLDERTRMQIGGMLARLTAPRQEALVAAMTSVESLLRPGAPPEIVLREPKPGDMGAVVRGHALLYAGEYGWDITFEAMVARIAADFIDGFQPGRERCWIADMDGAVVGSVFLVRVDDDTAKLRLLYVDAAVRGRGLGTRLVDACLAFAREAGYRRVVLWTNDILDAARHIYVARGFVLTGEDRHRSFGHDLVGQTWELDLTRAAADPATTAPSSRSPGAGSAPAPIATRAP